MSTSQGWLYSLPDEWNLRPLKRMGHITNSGSFGDEEPSSDRPYPLRACTTAHIDPEKGFKLDQMDVRYFSASERSKYVGRRGDIFVVKSSGSNTNVITGKRAQIVDQKEVVFTNFLLRVRPGKEVDPRFLFYVLGSAVVHERIKREVATTTYPNLNLHQYLSEPLPFPSVSEQARIARFLDRETDRIDQLLEKKRRFVPLLKEKRDAVIAHAVTKGINPKALLKESGEAWLGTMPAHWQVVPPTALFRESKERAREGDQMLSATQKYGVIPLAQFEQLEQRQVTMAFVHLDKRKHVEVGDFVISMRSMDGGLERARAVGSVRSSYSVLKAGPDVDGRFYGALLKSNLYIQALRQTANFIRDGQDMNFSHFRKVRLPKLPVREQSEIADYIEAETDRIDALIGLTERSVERLREYRAALITAAVTGQIDVANWNRKGTTNSGVDVIEAGSSV